MAACLMARWRSSNRRMRHPVLPPEAPQGSVPTVQVYTVHDIHSILPDEIVRRGAARNGLTWHFCRPPVIDLEYEMDCRQVSGERILAA